MCDLRVHTHHGMKVLVVDEHAGSRIATCVALSLRGFVSVHVGSAVEALDAIDRFRPDAVLTECWLNGEICTGLATRFRRRALALGHRLIIVILSWHHEPQGYRHSEEVDGYLTKPASIEEIEQLLVA
jgi:DNA-binding response OmpR family regulator